MQEPERSFMESEASGGATVSENKSALSITADPTFFEAIEIDVPEIPPGDSFEFKEPKLKISADFLLQLKERIKAKVSIKSFVAADLTPFEGNSKVSLI